MGLMGSQTSALTHSLSLSVSFLNPSLFIGLHLWLFFIHLYLFDCAQGLKNNITCVFSINRISPLVGVGRLFMCAADMAAAHLQSNQ